MIIVGSTQTGVDRAALYAAEAHEITIAGFVPRGHLTEEGPRPALTKRFGLVECMDGRTHAERYRERTRANVALVAAAERGAVLIIGQQSSGSNLTRALAMEMGVPWLWLDYIRGRWPWNKQPRGKLEHWLHKLQPTHLMVAGNRASGNEGIEAAAFELLDPAFARLAA